jgi:3',5'-cyclic-AMP phosphodiesterase
VRRPDGLLAPLGFRRPLPAVGVFAVETDAVQVVWRRLDGGTHDVTARAAGTTVSATVAATGGPGAVVLDGLPAGSAVEVSVDGRVVDRVTTLTPPPGEELCRFATVSDTHIGGTTFGRLPTVMIDAKAHDECLAGAIGELRAWGATFLAVKGDITETAKEDEWERAASLLSAADMPVVAVPGNHDVWRGPIEGVDAFAAAGLDLTVGGVAHHDLPGVRIVLVDATVPGHHHGTVAAHTEAVCDLVAGVGPVVVLLHQHLQRWRATTHWPPGVPGPEGRAFLAAVARANPDVVVSSGHSHRHRSTRVGPLVVCEVGAPKDFPGTWAGYAVHEGGIRQVVRRVSTPSAVHLTEQTSRTFGGAWARWSPGHLDHRCFSHTWRRPVDGSAPVASPPPTPGS